MVCFQSYNMLHFKVRHILNLTMYFILKLTVCLTIWHQYVLGSVILKDLKESEICESEDCLQSANHILKWLNPNVDPCVDFYEFTCGNWRNLPIDERVNKSIGSRKTLVDSFIPDLIKEPSAANGSIYFEMLRNFFISCTDEDTIQSLGVTPIKELIQKAGGWPVLDPDWSEEDWDFLTAEIALGGVLINVAPYYYRPENTFILGVKQSWLLTRYRPGYDKLVEGLQNVQTKNYYDRMVDVAVALGADQKVAEQAMKEVLEFEIAFIKELLNTTYSDKKTTFKELQEAAPWLDLTKLCQSYLPQSFKLLPEGDVIGEKEFFSVLQKLMKSFPKKTFVNYMISKAVYPMLKYVNYGTMLDHISREFDYDYLYEEPVKQTRFEYCTTVVTKGSLGPALAAYLGIMYSESSKVAADMTRVLIEELTKEVEETEWLDEVTRNEAAKNISEIKIDVGFPAKVTDLDELGKLYDGYEIDSSNFFNAIMYDKKWVKQREFDRIQMKFNDKKESLGWKYWMMKGLMLKAQFDRVLNAIDVSGPMLYHIPLFSPGNPSYVNYGHAGNIVAHELIHAVDLNAAPHRIKDKLFLLMKRWGSNETEQTYNQKKQCFIDFYSSFNDSITHSKLNGKYTLREDMADNGGLKLALRAYRKLEDQLGSPERKLPGLQQYSNEQLFMISVANAFCEIPTEESLFQFFFNDRHSPFEFRVKGIMMNSPDFSEIFNCEKKDPMNPPDKCEVW